MPFLDNITIKSPQTIYNKEESLLGVYKYILKYIIWLNKVLTDLKQTRCIILGIKSYFYKNEIIVVGYHYNRKGWYPEELKVAKIIY